MNSLCYMFCGWRQIFSKNRLVELGSGTLVLDLLRQSCTFNGKQVPPLPILEELRVWLIQDLHRLQVPLDEIDSVRLTVMLDFTVVEWDERTGGQFFADGRQLKGGKMYRCVTDCRSSLSSADAKYAPPLDG